METLIHAHRGSSDSRPENTMEAFSLAVEEGADMIELDVHLSKDGEIVVAHDARLERVSDGTGCINDFTVKELKSLNFNKLFPESPVCRIPTLSEVFSLIKPASTGLNIELKTIERIYFELPEKLVSLAKEYGLEERIIYSSFNHYSLVQIKKIKADAKTGLLYNLGLVDPWVYANYIHAHAIHPHYHIIAALPETVERCHEHGLKVNVWTVDSGEAVKMMLNYGVDGIITNSPAKAVAARNKFEKGEV